MKSNFLLVLLENIQLIPQLLRCLHGDSKKQENVVHPRYYALCLVSVKSKLTQITDLL